jgi:hypothetical protein
MRAVWWAVGVGPAAMAIAAFGIRWAHAASAIQPSTYRLDMYALELNGDAQIVNSIEGGFVDGIVVEEAGGMMPKKHLGGTTIEPIRARVRVDQYTAFLADALAGKADNAKGAIYYLDNSGKVQKQQSLTGLALSELAFPGLGGSANKAGNSPMLTMTLTAQSSKSVDPLAGALPPVKSTGTGPTPANQRWNWDFRFQVPGLPTQRVTAIEPFTIRRKVAATDKAQSPKETAKAATGPWEIPNLVLYMTPQDSQAWLAWHDDFVVQGHNADEQEKTFTLQLLSSDLKTTLLQFDGTGVGIISAKYEQRATTNAPASLGFRVELYVETMKISSPAMSTTKP